MNVRIPFASTSESAEPLRRCIARAARESGTSEYLTALVMSYFFEELAEQVSKNRVVRVPGVGAFGALGWTPRKEGLQPYAYPAFSAARGFRRQVWLACPADGAALDAIHRHRRHHHLSSRPDRIRSRPFTAMDAFRRQIRAQARRIGWEV